MSENKLAYKRAASVSLTNTLILSAYGGLFLIASFLVIPKTDSRIVLEAFRTVGVAVLLVIFLAIIRYDLRLVIADD